jgi:hypothetical protein
MSLTFSVVAEAHLGLAETNGVLALADAIELLELCLVDALHGFPSATHGTRRGNVWTVETYLAGDVQLNGLDADVLGSLRHDVCVVKRVEVGRKTVACRRYLIFVEGVGERGVGAGVCGRTMATRWGFGMKEGCEVSPQSGIARGRLQIVVGKGEESRRRRRIYSTERGWMVSRQRLH